MKNLKYLLLSALILVSVADIFGQLATRYPTNVRYIGGGYIDKRPQFSTLEAALNDVLPYATINNPYAFYIASDTIQIADWDSVFTGSGLTMKDSIDLYYVDQGKIKWFGFGFGGSGSGGGDIIPTQTELTQHYDYRNWDQSNSAYALWLRYLAQAVDSIDQHIYDLIVYTDSSFLYIENDTLKFRASALAIYGARPDTTLIVYKAGVQTIDGNKTYSGESIFTGSIRIPSGNNKTGTSRILWSAGDNIYFSGSGAAGDSSQLAEVSTSTGLLRNTVVGWGNLNQALKDTVTRVMREADVDHAYLTDATYTSTVGVAGTYVKYTPGWTTSAASHVTVAGDTIIVTAGHAGAYQLDIAFTYHGDANDDYSMQIRKNTSTVLRTLQFSGDGANEFHTASTFFYTDLVAGDDISIYITNTVDADDATYINAALFIERLHE